MVKNKTPYQLGVKLAVFTWATFADEIGRVPRVAGEVSRVGNALETFAANLTRKFGRKAPNFTSKVLKATDNSKRILSQANTYAGAPSPLQSIKMEPSTIGSAYYPSVSSIKINDIIPGTIEHEVGHAADRAVRGPLESEFTRPTGGRLPRGLRRVTGGGSIPKEFSATQRARNVGAASPALYASTGTYLEGRLPKHMAHLKIEARQASEKLFPEEWAKIKAEDEALAARSKLRLRLSRKLVDSYGGELAAATDTPWSSTPQWKMLENIDKEQNLARRSLWSRSDALSNPARHPAILDAFDPRTKRIFERVRRAVGHGLDSGIGPGAGSEANKYIDDTIAASRARTQP